MKEFKINNKATIICTSEGTRYGFRHLATLLIDGVEVDKSKACYYNRTWESYEFESVLNGLLNKTDCLTKRQKHIYLNKNIKKEKEIINNTFGTIKAIEQMGDILCEDKKDKNDWKLRMLKAGLSDKGLSIPEDWETLSEDEKETRLNKVIALQI